MVEKHPGKKFYNQYGLDWNDKQHKNLERLRSEYKADIFCKFIDCSCLKIRSVFDFGCGHGDLLASIGRRGNINKLFGMDLSETMLKIARKDHPKIIFKEGDEVKFATDKKMYDLVIFSDVLEHLENPGMVLRTAFKKSKFLFISLPIHKPIFQLGKDRKPRGYYSDGHLQEFSKSDVVELLSKSGWRVIQSESQYPPYKIVFHPHTLKVVASSATLFATLKAVIIKRILMRIPYFITSQLLAIKNGPDYYVLCKKMKKILINPDANLYRHVIPLALAYVATANKIKIIDQNTKPEPKDRFLLEKADEVGIFIRSVSVTESKRVAEAYREKFPKAKIKSIYTPIDVQCCYPTVQLKEQIKFIKPFGDTYPFPDYSLFDSFKVWLSHWQDGSWPYGILTSLGCPFQCIYCAARNRGWKPRSAKNCVEELKQAKKKYKIVSFEVLDDAFNVNKDRAMEFCRLVKPLGLRWIAANGLRADLLDEELAKAMADSGCDSVCFGVESVDKEVLKNIRKGETFEQIDRAVEISRRYFRNIGGFFIIGLPGSTYKKDLMSIEWMVKKQIMGVFSYYTPISKGGTDEMFFGEEAKPQSAEYPKKDQERIYKMVEFMQGPTTGRNFIERTIKMLLLAWKFDRRNIANHVVGNFRRIFKI